MKNVRLIIFALYIASPIFSYSQSGYIGKRFHVIFDTRLSPTALFPKYAEGAKFYTFTPHFSPSLEYVVGEEWVIGVSYQFQFAHFTPKYADTDYLDLSTPFKGLKSDINVHGFGVYGKHYFDYKAPLGYYTKIGLDYWGFKINSRLKYENQQDIATISDKDWALGFRIEIGKTIFVSKYVSLGTGFSFGFLTKGYRFMFNTLNDPIHQAATRLLSNYALGVNLSLGISPF